MKQVNKCDVIYNSDVDNILALSAVTDWRERLGGSSIPRRVKSTRAADSLSRRWFMYSICFRALYLFERRQGCLTALICLDSVIEEHRPLGAPNSRMSFVQWREECCRGRLKFKRIPSSRNILRCSWNSAKASSILAKLSVSWISRRAR